MIDGALKKPFFLRDEKRQVIGSESSSNWNNESKGVMMIDNYHKKMGGNDEDGDDENYNKFLDQDDDEDVDKMNFENEEEMELELERQLFLQRKKEAKPKLKKEVRNASFEVDFDHFLRYVWPGAALKYLHGMNIQPTTVWTEIYSYIKGKL